jgi:hypothetical protein
MRCFPLATLLLAAALAPALPVGAPVGAAGDAYEGIRWEADLEAGLARARLEGRPVLFAINALDEERANNELATRHYRSKAWGDATAGYVCFVCSPNDHTGPDGLSTRYHGIPSATNQAAFRLVVERYVEEPISPQHVIVEPDGTLAYRKAYYTGEVGPDLLEGWLSRIAPDVAYSQAAILREARIAALVDGPAENRPAAAREWVLTQDGLAAGGVLNVLDAVQTPAERLALISLLGDAKPTQGAVIEWGALDAVLAPDDDPRATLAWVTALLKVDRERGRLAAARALARSGDEALRTNLLSAWSGPLPAEAAPLDRLAGDERLAALEALALSGDARGRRLPTAVPAAWTERLARAAQRGGLTSDAGPAQLSRALQEKDAGRLAAALERAPRDEVLAARERVLEVLRTTPWRGVRARAAVALLRAGVAEEIGLVVTALVQAIDDLIEGPDVRPLAVAALGEDPGTRHDAWEAAVRRRLAGPPRGVPGGEAASGHDDDADAGTEEGR